MRLSVIVATRDRASALAALLDRLKAQRLRPGDEWEAIVVDDGSRDGTAAILREAAGPGFPLIVLHQARLGKPCALNAGLARAVGEVIAFTDDDCLPPPTWLADIAAQFSGEPTLAGLGGRVLLEDAADRPVAVRTRADRWELTSARDLYEFAIGANMAFRRSVVDDVGGFDPNVGPGAFVPSGNDIDLIYRVFHHGHRIAFIPEVTVYHRHGRRTDEDTASVHRRYSIGRGGFYAKYGLRGHAAVIGLGLREFGDALRGADAQRLGALLRGFGRRVGLDLGIRHPPKLSGPAS